LGVIAAPGVATHPTSSPGLELVDELDALREDWTRLAADAANIFATWEWSDLWWRHYGSGRELRIAVSRQEDEIAAIVPLFMWSRRPFRILRLIGHGHGDRLGPICRDDLASGALSRALAAEPHDVFVGDWVAGDRDWAGVLEGRVVRSTGYPILRFRHGSWDEFLARRSGRFRKSLRNRENRLRRHEVSFRYTDTATLERDLDAAFRLHRSNLGEHSGCLFCGDHEAFQREFAALALDRGWLRLLFMEVDGRPVCCEYGFFFENAYFAYQGGRDPDWNRESVGFVLEVESIRRSLEEGAAEYRYLGGEEGYKYRFPIEDPRLQTVLAPATARGRIVSAALAATWRLPGGRDILRRVGSARA
jgi:CelD/BcsL family acetyltransferase involved in cellulose biosynthesis